MDILFLTLLSISSVKEHTIYTDLLRQFIANGDSVYIVSPFEKKAKKATQLIKEGGDCPCEIIKPRIGNIQKTNVIEKGISTVTLESQIKAAIKKYWSDKHFDLILYSTPPITLTGLIAWIKERDNAKTYLLLKDIFPQNAVDMGMLSTTGIKGVLYQYFRRKEKRLYAISDRIGCMSPANVEYVLKHNPEVAESKVEVCPNCIEAQDVCVTAEERVQLRGKYGIPLDKKVFVYGGNLGKPQEVPFIIECLKACQSIDDVFFFVVGSGTDYDLLEEYVKTEKPENVRLLPSLPKDEYDHMLAACDVGLIFLDHRFTIPNFPSRLLSYMQAGLPVLACTDRVSDIGNIIIDGGFGWWCESNDADEFAQTVRNLPENFDEQGKQARQKLQEFYSVDASYTPIVRSING